ncbi:hypothetical protein EP47_12745 [Legionella norrlandica]|uniref:DUF559 domain-containing protein n=1 Tax=Legionella norrlandica TaxID=1498499 RepID=A0A0A2T482_9GAMM|nr:DUF559 domain-containing protein [Legionella norrlandica]KGP62233.1 hypothetical protein EP47_12745 [Legionella norrlandica]
MAVAKLIEAGQITQANALHVNDLLALLHAEHQHTNTQGIVNGLWAVAIISTVNPLSPVAIPSDFINHAVSLVKKEGDDIRQKTQVIMALSLLNEDKNYDIDELIVECRPQSNLNYRKIHPYLKGQGVTYALEAFVGGFFVDLLLKYADGKNKIIEFDGPTHLQRHQQAFDKFKDKILSAKGYEVERVVLSNDHSKKGANVNNFFKPFSEQQNARGDENKSVFRTTIIKILYNRRPSTLIKYIVFRR